MENSSEDAAKQSGSNVGTLVHELCLWGSWVDSGIHHLLENWLNDSDCWVDAAPGDASGGLYAGIEGNTNGDRVNETWMNWGLIFFGTVSVNDLQHEGHKQEGHHELNEESLSHQLAAIVAAVGWAKLSQVVSSSLGELAALLGSEREAHEAQSATEHAAKDLGQNDEEGVKDCWSAFLMLVLDKDGDGNSWVEVAVADWAEYAGHHENDHADALSSGARGASPVNCGSEHCCSEELRDENPGFIF